MLFLELKPLCLFPTVPRILGIDDLVMFSPHWPQGLGISPGQTYKVEYSQQVPYDLNYILPGNDYRDVNFSNEEAGEKLYPTQSESLFEILIGLKEGNFSISPYMPIDQPVFTLEHTEMRPSVIDPKRRYLGAIRPENSPADDPRIKLYTVLRLTPFFWRVFVDQGDYEKCTLSLIINRLKIEKIEQPTPEQLKKARKLPYITEVARRIVE